MLLRSIGPPDAGRGDIPYAAQLHAWRFASSATRGACMLRRYAN